MANGVDKMAQMPELRKKLAWTLFILCMYRVGEGYQFVGWYENDKLISQETQYRFCVEKDTLLVAKYISLLTVRK